MNLSISGIFLERAKMQVSLLWKQKEKCRVCVREIDTVFRDTRQIIEREREKERQIEKYMERGGR